MKTFTMRVFNKDDGAFEYRMHLHGCTLRNAKSLAIAYSAFYRCTVQIETGGKRRINYRNGDFLPHSEALKLEFP